MRQSAAVLCRDKFSLKTLETVLEGLGMELIPCSSNQEALELVVAGRSSTLIVDFDLPVAQDVVRMAAMLPPAQKPVLLAVASRAWPGTGQAFQSGASRILYRPLDQEELKDALKTAKKTTNLQRRRSTRYEAKTLIYLELEHSTLPAITIDISEHGLALQATEPVPMSSNVAFRCVLPGTNTNLHGHAEVIWASDQGRAGLFFSKLSTVARKQLKHWLHKKSQSGKHGRDHKHEESSVREILPHEEAHVSFAASE